MVKERIIELVGLLMSPEFLTQASVASQKSKRPLLKIHPPKKKNLCLADVRDRTLIAPEIFSNRLEYSEQTRNKVWNRFRFSASWWRTFSKSLASQQVSLKTKKWHCRTRMPCQCSWWHRHKAHQTSIVLSKHRIWWCITTMCKSTVLPYCYENEGNLKPWPSASIVWNIMFRLDLGTSRNEWSLKRYQPLFRSDHVVLMQASQKRCNPRCIEMPCSFSWSCTLGWSDLALYGRPVTLYIEKNPFCTPTLAKFAAGYLCSNILSFATNFVRSPTQEGSPPWAAESMCGTWHVSMWHQSQRQQN